MKTLVAFFVIATTSFAATAKVNCERISKEAIASNSTLQQEMKISLINMKLEPSYGGRAKAASDNTDNLSKQLLQTSHLIISAINCYEANKLVSFTQSADQSVQKVQELVDKERELDGGYALDQATQSTVNGAYEALKDARTADWLLENLIVNKK